VRSILDANYKEKLVLERSHFVALTRRRQIRSYSYLSNAFLADLHPRMVVIYHFLHLFFYQSSVGKERRSSVLRVTCKFIVDEANYENEVCYFASVLLNI
jgi:hypothetical protein